MWKWVFFVVVPLMLLVGGVAWYLTISGESAAPGQSVQVEDPAAIDQESPSPTLAPDQRPQPQTPGPGWALDCSSGARDRTLNCRLSQAVVMKGSGRLLTRVTFRLPNANQQPQLHIQLPLGVSVPGGVSVQVDGSEPQGLGIRTCDRGGCYAEAALSNELLAQLRKGSQLKVAFKNLAEKTISLPLSLGGFDEAYTRAEKV